MRSGSVQASGKGATRVAGGEWIGSTGPSLVGQPLSLMRCEEVSLIPGGVPHGAVLLLLQEPPSVLLQTSAPGPSLVAVADDHGFILWPPATAAESGLLSHVGSLSRLPASSPVATCCPDLLHPPQEKPGVWPRGSHVHGWSQTPIHFSPSLAALAVPWAPGIRQALETCLLIGQIIVPILCGYHKNI